MKRSAGGFALLATPALFLLSPGSAYAGMPSFTLTDLASARFEAISFFIALLLVVSLLVKLLWNYLASRRSLAPRRERIRFCRDIGRTE